VIVVYPSHSLLALYLLLNYTGVLCWLPDRLDSVSSCLAPAPLAKLHHPSGMHAVSGGLISFQTILLSRMYTNKNIRGLGYLSHHGGMQNQALSRARLTKESENCKSNVLIVLQSTHAILPLLYVHSCACMAVAAVQVKLCSFKRHSFCLRVRDSYFLIDVTECMVTDQSEGIPRSHPCFMV